MGRHYDRLDGRLREFIAAQPMYFVATGPLVADGRINLSPKGREGCLTVLDERCIGYVDFGGSHAETLAHLRENGRITLMWCAFNGPPNILRVYGRGEPVFRDDPRWTDLLTRIDSDGPVDVRAIVLVHLEDVRDSCGFAVPLMEHLGPRDLHAQYFARKSDAEFAAYCASKEFNRVSIDGLPALPLPLPPQARS